MRTITMLLSLLAVGLLAAPSRPQERAVPAGKVQTDASFKKVRELQAERITVLQKMTDQYTDLFRNARVEYDQVLEAKRLLAEAVLDAAETDAERVKCHRNLVIVLKQQEEWVRGQWDAARLPETNVLKARARRLEAEVQLELARMKIKDIEPEPASPQPPPRRPEVLPPPRPASR